MPCGDGKGKGHPAKGLAKKMQEKKEAQDKAKVALSKKMQEKPKK